MLDNVLGGHGRRVLAVALCALACATACVAKGPRQAAKPAPDTNIGYATMDADETIVLDLRATAPGVHGEAQLRYPKGHQEYDAVLKHLGGLRPGESKPVPPWPDSP